MEEEQTVYWSAEENPYIYKQTKRYLHSPTNTTSAHPQPYYTNHTTVGGVPIEEHHQSYHHYTNLHQSAVPFASFPSVQRARQREGEAVDHTAISSPESWRNGHSKYSVGTQTRTGHAFPS